MTEKLLLGLIIEIRDERLELEKFGREYKNQSPDARIATGL